MTMFSILMSSAFDISGHLDCSGFSEKGQCERSSDGEVGKDEGEGRNHLSAEDPTSSRSERDYVGQAQRDHEWTRMDTN